MPTLVIHAGPPKTGSTTLQKYLASDQAQLNGWIYPNIGRIREDLGQHNIFHEVRADKTHDPAVTSMAAYIELLDQGGDIILSSEDVPLWPQALKTIVHPATERGYHVKIVVFVRDPIDRLNSMYTQQIKTLVFNMEFDAFVVQTRPEAVFFPFSIMPMHVRETGADLVLLPFLPTQMHKVYQWLSDDLGISLPIEPQDISNSSPSFYQVAAFRHLGERLRGMDYWRAMSEGLNTIGHVEKFYGFDDALFAETKSFFEREYSRENLDLLSCYPDEFAASLFSQPRRIGPDIKEDAFANYIKFIEARLGLT